MRLPGLSEQGVFIVMALLCSRKFPVKSFHQKRFHGNNTICQSFYRPRVTDMATSDSKSAVKEKKTFTSLLQHGALWKQQKNDFEQCKKIRGEKSRPER